METRNTTEKNSGYSSKSTEWIFLSLDFFKTIRGIKLIYD